MSWLLIFKHALLFRRRRSGNPGTRTKLSAETSRDQSFIVTSQITPVSPPGTSRPAAARRAAGGSSSPSPTASSRASRPRTPPPAWSYCTRRGGNIGFVCVESTGVNEFRVSQYLEKVTTPASAFASLCLKFVSGKSFML